MHAFRGMVRFCLVVVVLLGLLVARAGAAWNFPDKFRAVHFWQPKTATADGSFINLSLRGLNQARLDADMLRISQQGFNTITFWVNWGDLMPAIQYVDNVGDWWTNGVKEVWDYQLHPNDPDNYEARLLKVVRSAKKNGLSVLILPFTGTNPDLYSNAGITASTRVCNRPYGIIQNPYGAGASCPDANYEGHDGYMFKDANLFGMYTRFLNRVSYVLKDEENVYGFDIDWETGKSAGNVPTYSHIQLMSDALKLYNSTKRTGYKPDNFQRDNRYYVVGTDVVFLSWYGSDPHGTIEQYVADSRSLSEQYRPADKPTLPMFVYEFGYDDRSNCTTYTNATNKCSTVNTATFTLDAASGRANQKTFVEIIVPKLENDPSIVGYSYWGSQDNESDRTNPHVFLTGLITQSDTPKPAWDSFGLLNKTPEIAALGLGCAQQQCIWISGKRFAGQFEDATLFPGRCHVDIYKPDWTGILTTVYPDSCTDGTITFEIPLWIRSGYTAVIVNVTNKYGKWSAPRYVPIR